MTPGLEPLLETAYPRLETELEERDVVEAARFRVEWMAHHLAEAHSDYDLWEHFGWQLVKAYGAGNRSEELINVAALGMVKDPHNKRVAELRRRQVAWRALRMKSSRHRDGSTRPMARARSPRTRTRRTCTSSSKGGGDPPDPEPEPDDVEPSPAPGGRLGVAYRGRPSEGGA